MEFLDGVMQWLHVLAAVLVIGGIFFLRFILCPSLQKLGPDQDSAKMQILQSTIRKFKVVIHTSIAILLLTGIHRLVKTLPLVKDWSQYHMLIGIKILLALVLFTIAILLTLPGEKPNLFQRNRDRWLLASFVLGALIILISATLRRMWDHHG